jgi:hypothetical protein
MAAWPASSGCDGHGTRRSVAVPSLSKGSAETFCDPYARVVITKRKASFLYCEVERCITLAVLRSRWQLMTGVSIKGTSAQYEPRERVKGECRRQEPASRPRGMYGRAS